MVVCGTQYKYVACLIYQIICKDVSSVKNKLIIKWIGEDNYSSVTYNQVDVLGENLSDDTRATKSKHIMQQYNVALGLRFSYIHPCLLLKTVLALFYIIHMDIREFRDIWAAYW